MMLMTMMIRAHSVRAQSTLPTSTVRRQRTAVDDLSDEARGRRDAARLPRSERHQRRRRLHLLPLVRVSLDTSASASRYRLLLDDAPAHRRRHGGVVRAAVADSESDCRSTSSSHGCFVVAAVWRGARRFVIATFPLWSSSLFLHQLLIGRRPCWKLSYKNNSKQ